MTTTEILTEIINDILNEPLRLYEVLSGCTKYVNDSKFSSCQVVPCGPKNAKVGLVTALKSETRAEVTVYEKALNVPSLLRLNSRPRTSKKPKLAIVGMAGRFPNAADHHKFWDLLYAGQDLHKEVRSHFFDLSIPANQHQIPPDRFDVKTHCDPTGKARNTSHTPYGCFIDDPGLFDPRFFNMSPREALQTDPMARLSLTSAYEAMEMAGYVPNRTPSTNLDRIGTFYGQTSDDWREINAAQEIDTYHITGGVRAFAPVSPRFRIRFNVCLMYR